jgi:hypothetical protein
VKGKWASGIAPRNFAWIIKDRLAISERPGGYARSHRPVRRQEEIIWIREQGFARVVSLLTSPHNLHAYDELGVSWEHIPLPLHEDPRVVLGELYPKLAEWLAKDDKVLLHQEELSDRLLGVVGPRHLHRRADQLPPDGPTRAGAGGHRLVHGETEPLR